MRIGIFGGSFNPPHYMHKNIALQLLEKDYLDKIIYVPTGSLYKKANLASDKDRYEMVKRMIISNKYLEVSDYEFGKLTFTYQTLNYFLEQYPNDEIYFICGSDNFKQLDTWKNYKYLLENFRFIVIPRNDDNIEELVLKYKKEGYFVIIPNLSVKTISSTEIRDILRKDRYSRILSKKIDKPILDYIYQNNLYY